MADREFLLRVVGDVSDAQKSLKSLDQSVSGMQTGFSKAGGLLKGAVAAVGASVVVDQIVQFGKSAVTAASDTQQAMGASQSVFGEFSGEIDKFSKRTAENMGISRDQFLQMSSVTGALLKNTGAPMEEVTGLTKDLSQRAADMAATFGGPVDGALAAINSALKGEFDPLEQFGVSLRASAIDAKAQALGLTDAKGKATNYGKAMAATQLIMEQSADSAGAFARESDTLAGKSAIMSAKWRDMQAELGQKLLPIVAKVTAFITDEVMPAFEDFVKWVEKNWPPIYEEYVKPAMKGIQDIITQVVAVIGPLWEKFGGNIMRQIRIAGEFIKSYLKGAFAFIKGLFQVIGGVLSGDWKKAWEGIRNIVRGIVGPLIAQVRYLVKTIGNIFSAVWKVIGAPFRKGFAAIRDVIGNMVDWFKDLPSRIGKAIRTMARVFMEPFRDGYRRVRDVMGDLIDWFKDLPTRVGRAIRTIVSVFTIPFRDAYQRVRDVITSMVDWFRNLPTRIGNAIRATVSAVATVFRDVVAKVKEIATGIVEWFKLLPERVANAARSVVGLLASPFRDAVTKVKEVGQGIIDWFKDLPDRVSDAISDMTDIVTAPFRSAVDGIKSIWNSTVGGFGFTVPSWIPKIGGKEFRIPEMAAGGIVTRPTIALIGEAGPEAVVPLGHGAGVGTTIINVYALTPTAEVGRKVHEALREFQRTSGRIP